MARPKAIIDWRKVNAMLRAQCSGVAVAGLLGVHADTLYNAVKDKYKLGFSAYSEQKRSEGKELLRYRQYQAALNGNVAMMIWMGKNILGQSDKQTITNPEAKNIHITVDSPATEAVLRKLLEDDPVTPDQ